MSESVSADQAIGARVRALREAAHASREDLARASQRAGMSWGADRIAHLESARATSATLANMVALAQALTEVSGQPVTLPDLLPEDGTVELSVGRRFSAAALRTALVGGPVPRPEPPQIRSIVDPRLEPGWGQVDDRIVADTGHPPEAVRVATRDLYARTATQERDRRAGEGATPQKRGRVTRVVVAEVVAEVARNAEIDSHY